MDKYVEYIENLLYLYDCVILPGFGGLICNYTAATIESKSGLFTPPSKIVIFNKHLQQNDGLLIHWIAQKENINYEKAQKRLSLFCEEIKVRLNQKQKVEFGTIGTFYTDRCFNIIFEPSTHNFLPDAIGMDSFHVIPLKGKKNRPEEYINTEPGNLINRLFKYGLSAAVIAGIIIISQQDIFKSDTPSETTNMQPVSVKEKIATPKQIPIISPDYDFVDFDPFTSLNEDEDNLLRQKQHTVE